MCHCFLGKLCKVCVWIQSQMYGGNKNETSLMTAQKQPGQRCVSGCVCVACDFKVTDGASVLANRLPRRHCSQGLF